MYFPSKPSLPAKFRITLLLILHKVFLIYSVLSMESLVSKSNIAIWQHIAICYEAISNMVLTRIVASLLLLQFIITIE